MEDQCSNIYGGGWGGGGGERKALVPVPLPIPLSPIRGADDLVAAGKRENRAGLSSRLTGCMMGELPRSKDPPHR